MSRNFAKRRLDLARVMPEKFLAEFRTKDASTRRFLLNALTLFATVSPEQQHQAINDLIQSELVVLADKSQKFLERRVREILSRFHIAKTLSERETQEYYYRYYMLTGVIPEKLTPDCLNLLLRFVVGTETIKMLFRMSFMEQQRFFELQGKYSTQAMLFYRYIKPIRAKLFREEVLKRDASGNHYYRHLTLEDEEILDYVFDIFELDRVLYLGDFAERLVFEPDYIFSVAEEGVTS